MLLHLESHGIKVATTKEKGLEFTQAMSYFNVAKTADIQQPAPCGPPIECLKITANGYCCNHCQYCVPTYATFKNHWSSSVHKNDKGSSTTAYHMGFIQSFYSHSPQRWFEVIPALAGLPLLDPFAVYLKTETSKFLETINEPPTHVREIPPLLNVTSWHIHLAEHIKTKEDIKSMCSLVKLPPFKETTGLARLREIVDKYMKDIRTMAHASSIGIKCLLMECPRYISIHHYFLWLCSLFVFSF
jgi:hypothetical protein